MTSQYTVIVFITAFSMAAMMAAVKRDSFIGPSRKRRFFLLFGLLIVVNLAEWLGVWLNGAAAGLRSLHILAKFVEFTLTPAVPVVCVSAVGGERNERLMVIPTGINLALQIFSLFSGSVFSVDAGNNYSRGPLYFLYVATFFCGMVFLFVHCYRFSRRYQNRSVLFLAMIVVLVAAAMVMPLAARDLRLDWAAVSIAAILFYVYYEGLVQQVDALTGLLNRNSYNCRIAGLREPAAILFFDADRFKEVNDTYGHSFGDVCLAGLAAAVRGVCGKYGSCYRFGGDEFCAILTRKADPEKLVSAFSHRMEELRAREPRLPRASVGYALFDPARETAEDAVRRADAMMYAFKQKRHAEKINAKEA